MTAGPSWSLGFVFAPTLVCLYALIIPPPPRALPWKIPIVIRVQVKDESVWIIWPSVGSEREAERVLTYFYACRE